MSKQYAEQLLNKINQWQVQVALNDNATVLAAIMADLMAECGKIPREQPKEQETLPPPPKKKRRQAVPPPPPTVPELEEEDDDEEAEEIDNLGLDEEFPTSKRGLEKLY